MARVHLDDRAQVLLAPVWGALEQGLAQVPPGPTVHVTVGEVSGFYQASASSVILSHHLEGEAGIHHPDEATDPLPPLDRWRRAAASVLEGAAMATLAARTQTAPTHDWWWYAVAIHVADVAAPDLGVASPDLARALSTGSPGEHPRAGVAVARAWINQGIKPIPRVKYLIEGGVISADEWLTIGAWVFGPRGPRSLLPVAVSPAPPVDIPVELPPWTWRRLQVPAHPRGGHVRVQGNGVVDDAWAEGGQELRALAAAADGGCRLLAEVGGPVGSWEVASAEGFGQVMGARGVTYIFRADGRLELVMADAFVGPLAALRMAGEVGTSGSCTGKWRVAGPHALRFADIDTAHLTMHGHRERFMMPAQGFGMGEWLKAMADEVWRWQPTKDGRLLLTGRMMGGAVEVRLRPSAGPA